MSELREIIAAYPGDDYLYAKDDDSGKLYRVSDKFSIESLSVGELSALFGEKNIKIN